MSIFIIRGPHTAPISGAASPASFHTGLRKRARAAGQTLRLARFRDPRGLLACLRRARLENASVVLLDSGELPLRGCEQAPQLRAALDALPSPYIEVHDDAAQSLEPQLQPRHAPLVTVILRNDLDQAYALALDIALRRTRNTDTAEGRLHA